MKTILNKSFRNQLIAFALLLSLIPLIVTGVTYYLRMRAQLIDDSYYVLDLSKEMMQKNLLENLNRNINLVKVISETAEVEEVYRSLKEYKENLRKNVDGSVKYDMNRYQQLTETTSNYFEDFLAAWQFDNAIIVDKDGFVMYMQNPDGHFAKALNSKNLTTTPLASIYNNLLNVNKPVLSDYNINPYSGKPQFYIGAPIIIKGEQLGYFIVQLDNNKLNAIMGSGFKRHNETHEVLVSGTDYLMRSNSILVSENTVLNTKIAEEPVDLALKNGSGYTEVFNFRGKKIFCSYSLIDFKEQLNFFTDFKWVILSEMEVNEAFKPIIKIRRMLFSISIVLIVFIILLSYYFARSATKPLIQLSKSVEEIGNGQLNSTLEQTNRSDEIGVLFTSFEKMKTSLHNQINQIIEAVNVLTTSATEITTTITQLASSTNETVTALSQTSTTMQEVQQTAQQTREKAVQVIESSESTRDVSVNGENAVLANKEGMLVIQKQMDKIAESIVKLSEQSRSIGTIMDTINDLSEQSNLLAVNAAIEAAKAGEEGKGFAVVATEIKNLATQSKKATNEVRNILAEIQKATSKTVMSTEEGSKAVIMGIEYSENTVGAIKQLTEVLDQAVSSANKIGASVQQQFVGIDQVTSAMHNINDASKQNLEGTNQLEQAATKLLDLGEQLKELIAGYKV